MKKNKFLKIASGLLMLVLITCCAVSGTFAKYTTSGEATDTARVAKWGITMSVTLGDGTSDSFLNNYDNTVIGASSAIVVAPGTSGTLFSFSINGTSEVDYALAITFTINSEIMLAAADDTYLDYTTANNTTDTFDLADDYYPVKYSVAKDGADVGTFNTLDELKAYLEGLAQATVEAGVAATNVGTYTITWEWVIGGNEQADTFLGMQDPLQEIEYNFEISATQID